MSELKEPLLMFNKYHIDKVRDSGSHSPIPQTSREEGKDIESDHIELKDENAINTQNQQMNENDENSKENDNLEEAPKPKKCNWKGWIIRILIVLVLAGIALWAILDTKRLSRGFEAFIDFLRDNPILAPFILILAYIVATILFLPGLILTLGAGFAFNQAYGNVGSKSPIC